MRFRDGCDKEPASINHRDNGYDIEVLGSWEEGHHCYRMDGKLVYGKNVRAWLFFLSVAFIIIFISVFLISYYYLLLY